MKNKWKRILIFSVFMFILSGCSLAREDASSSARLVGVFITSESLNLNEERLYATINKTGAADIGDWKLSFEGQEGVLFLVPEWIDEDGERLRGCIADHEICHQNTESIISDGTESLQLSADIYTSITENKNTMKFYLNPVYQTEHDTFYVVSGTCSSADIGENEGVLSQKISEEKTVNSGKEKIKEKLEVQVRMSARYAPEKIWIVQMNAEDQVLKRAAYTPGELPESITAEEEAAYFIVKTEYKDKTGKNVTEAELYELDNSIEIFCVSDKNSSFLSVKNIEICKY